MKKTTIFLVLVVALTNVNAQSTIRAYGSKPKTGQVILGVVRDTSGPVKAADVFEVNRDNEVVAYTFTDKNGHFSFELVDPTNTLLVGGFKYNTAKSDITNNQYDIVLEKFPELLNNEMNTLFRNSFRSLIKEAENYPFLWMDGHVIFRDSKVWEGIDPNKNSYSKQEMSSLFGVEAGQIEMIKVYEKGDQSATEMWGAVAERGVIEIQTKTNNGNDQAKGSR